MLLFWSVQARQCLCSTVYGSISKGVSFVSFTQPIACRLLYNRVCNNSYNSSLGTQKKQMSRNNHEGLF